MKNNTLNIKNNSDKKNTRATNVLLALYFVLSSLYIPVFVSVSLGEWLTPTLALSVGVLGIAALARAAGSFRAVAGFSVTVGILAFFGGAFLPLAMFVAFAAASVVYAYLTQKLAKWFVYALPLIPVLAALVITGEAWGVILAFASAPCGILLAYCSKKKLDRAAAVCRISAAICALTVLLVALAVYYRYESISAASFRLLIDEARTELTLMLNSTLAEMKELLDTPLAGFDLESISAMLISSVFNLLPAIIITLANIISYLMHSLWLSVKYADAKDKKEALPQLALELSPVTAAVYIIALVLSLALVSDSAAIYSAVAENILLVLCPGLVLTALAGIRALSTAKGPSCLGTLLYFVLIFAIASLSPIVILATALIGAVLILVATFTSKKNNKDKN